MMGERKTEQFETDTKKWRLNFDFEIEGRRGDNNILVSFVLNRDKHGYLDEETLKELKQDLKDLGKLRIIKQGKEFLEKWKRKKRFLIWLKMDVILS